MTSTPEAQKRGSALVLTLAMVTILLGTLSLLMVALSNQAKHGGMSQILARSLLAAENGMALAKAKLLEDPIAYNAESGSTFISANNATVLIWAEDVTGTSITYRLESTGTVAGRSRTIQLIVELKQNAQPLELVAGFPAAVLSTGTIELDDDLNISGNDHDNMGNYPGPDYLRHVALDVSGAGGGSVNVLNTGPDGDTDYVQMSGPVGGWYNSTGTRVKTSSATTFWASDGIDNDRDGNMDALDPTEFPARPGHLFGFDDETPLIEAATASGTYFSGASAFSDYESWRGNIGNGSGKNTPSGKVIYVEIDNSGGAVTIDEIHIPRADPSWGAGETGEYPTVFIVTGSDATTHDISLTNLHQKDKEFNGLVVVDEIIDMKDGVVINGGLFIFNSASGTSKLHKDMQVMYSSDVLVNDAVNGSGTDLPGVSDPSAPWDFLPILWREIPN